MPDGSSLLRQLRFQNIVKRGDKVLIKVNTVIPCPPDAGFTTDPRILEALLELVQEQAPARVLIGERSAMGGDTRKAVEVCGVTEVARHTGAELCPFEEVPFDMYKIDGRSPSTSFRCHGPCAMRTFISACPSRQPGGARPSPAPGRIEAAGNQGVRYSDLGPPYRAG